MEHTQPSSRKDGILHISLLGGQARALLSDTTELVETARQTHALGRVATAALGRLLTATIMMGIDLKGEDHSITATIKGGGPIGTLIAVARSNGDVKGYVQHGDVDLPRRGEKLPVGDAVGQDGMLTIIKDLGLREPYVGQVHLVSGEIAEDFAMYFTASEQVPSLVSLGVITGDHVEAAGGLIVQMLPGADEAALHSVELSAPMFANISGTIREYGLQGAMYQLLAHLEPVILSESAPRYRCDCTDERVERALISLGEAELVSMIEEQELIEVDCQFCNRRRTFDMQALMALRREAAQGRGAAH